MGVFQQMFDQPLQGSTTVASQQAEPQEEIGEEKPPPGLSFMEEMRWIKQHKAKGGQVAPSLPYKPQQPSLHSAFA